MYNYLQIWSAKASRHSCLRCARLVLLLDILIACFAFFWGWLQYIYLNETFPRAVICQEGHKEYGECPYWNLKIIKSKAHSNKKGRVILLAIGRVRASGKFKSSLKSHQRGIWVFTTYKSIFQRNYKVRREKSECSWIILTNSLNQVILGL